MDNPLFTPLLLFERKEATGLWPGEGIDHPQQANIQEALHDKVYITERWF
jgi:hypothetical protein